MSAIRPEFHTNLVRNLRDNVFYERTNLFYFLGKIDSWPTEVTPPAAPSNAYNNDITIRNNMLYVRKVTANDVTLVCPTHFWTSGTAYTQWDDTAELQGQPFYVVTDEYNVYKCLNNNNGAASTVKPTGTSLTVTSTADGYLWKYMYNVPIVKRRKFFSSQYLPVQKALTDSFYSKGAIEEVLVVNGGSGYSSDPQTTVAVSSAPAGGTTAEISVFVNADTGEIDSVDIVNPGSGYVTAPTLTVVGTGEGKYAGNETAILTAYIYNGAVDRVAIEDPGTGYSADTSTTISSQGDGTGAVFYPKIEDGIITGVIVANPGINYTYITLQVVSSTGSGADLEAVIGASDFLSDQSQVEQAAIKGAIYAVKVSTAGEGYTNTTTVTINGDGTGATAHAVVSNGAIQQIVMDTYGTGYTYATVTIADVNRLEPNTFVDAQAYAILPPANGHGFDAVKELFGDTMAIFVLVRDDPGLNAIQQDYRQFGLINNPTNITTKQLISSSASQVVTFECNMVSVDGLVIDEILVNNNVRYRLVDIDVNKITVQQLSSQYATPSGTFTREVNPTIAYTISSVVSSPTFDKYSGDLLFVSNNTPFVPTESQAFGIRTYITL